MNPWTPLQTRLRALPSSVRYLVVGAVSYAIDIGVLIIAWRLLDLPLWIATSCGFWSSFSANFLLSRYWTFEAAHVPSGGQLKRFGLLVALNYVVTVLAVTGLHRAGLEVLTARTLTLVALTASTFFVYKKWVFVSR